MRCGALWLRFASGRGLLERDVHCDCWRSSFHRCGTLACSKTSCAEGAEKEYDAKKRRTGAAVHVRRRHCGRCVVVVKFRAAASPTSAAKRPAVARRDRVAPHRKVASLARRARANGAIQRAAGDTVAIVERLGDVPRRVAARGGEWVAGRYCIRECSRLGRGLRQRPREAPRPSMRNLRPVYLLGPRTSARQGRVVCSSSWAPI